MGRGNFANVYEAKSSKGGKVFLKEYHDPSILSKEYRSFINHNDKLKVVLDKLGNIVENNYEFFEFDDRYFQAKEMLTGNDLEYMLYNSEEELTWKQRLQIATVIVGAIKILHNNNIIHTDLKPSQIFITKNEKTHYGWQVKLCDFDFSRLIDESEPHIYVSSPQYSSPEHIKNETPGKESDIFTLGLILYELLAYLHPLAQGEDGDYESDALNRKNVKPPKDYNDQIPEELSDEIFQMLDPDKNNRPTAESIHSKLIEIYNQFEKDDEKKEEEPVVTDEDEDLDNKGDIIRIELHEGNAYLSVYKDGTYGRNDFRRILQNYRECHPKQFRLNIKSAEIEGLEVPPSLTKDGKTYNFYPTFLNGKDITGKKSQLSEGDQIEIGNLKITVKLVRVS